MSEFYTYAFVRLDLPVAQQIIQVAHAVHEAAVGNVEEQSAAPNLVLFQVENEAELLKVEGQLRQRLAFSIFYEPNHDRGYTALATIPLHRVDPLRSLFERYKLYGAPLLVPSGAS